MQDNTARLLAFPIDRRTTLVRRAAEELMALNGDDANNYWRVKARALLQELTGQGREMDAARQEVLRFFEAVQVEFRKELTRCRSIMPA